MYPIPWELLAIPPLPPLPPLPPPAAAPPAVTRPDPGGSEVDVDGSTGTLLVRGLGWWERLTGARRDRP